MKIIILLMVFTSNDVFPPRKYAIASVYDTMNECIAHSKDYKSLYPANAIECVEVEQLKKE